MTNTIKKIDNFEDLITTTNYNSEQTTSADTEEIEEYSEEQAETESINVNPIKSTDLLHDKLIGDLDNLSLNKGAGVLPMGAYGIVKGIIEHNPMISAAIKLTECLGVSAISSETVAKIATKGLEIANGALLPEEWQGFGEQAFKEIESNFAKAGKVLGDNINIIRSTGARVNVIINTVFAGVDGYRVADYYIQEGQDAMAHVGEISGRVIGEAAGGAGGFAIGAAAGSAGAAAITGAVCGSVVPGVGTAVGLIVGAVVGAIGAVVVGDIGATAGSYVDGNNGEIVNL